MSEEPETGGLVPAAESRLASAGGGLAGRGLALASDLLANPAELVREGEIACLRGHADCVLAVAFSPDGRQAATASWDQTVRLWELPEGREALRISAHAHRVSSVAFSADGRWLISGGWDGTVRLWDALTGRELARFGDEEEGIVHAVALSPEGRVAAWGGSRSQWALVDLEAGTEIRRGGVPVGPVRCLRFSPDGRLLATGSGQVAVAAEGRDNGSVLVWDVGTGARIWGWTGGTEPALGLAFSPDGRRLFAATGWPAPSRLNVTRAWEAETGTELEAYEAHRQPIFACAYLPGGRVLLGGRDRLLRVWDPGEERETLRLAGHADAVFSVAVSPDGRLALSGSGDRTARLWRLPVKV